MKEAHSQSPCPEQIEKRGLIIHKLSFLDKGPYSIDVEPGECVGLTGKSGIGKTQLLRAVADVIVHTGDCFLNEYSCQSMEAPEWRKTVALVPAESFWWHDIVGDHFAEIDLHGEFADLLKRLGFSLVDCQVYTPHLASLGAREIRRQDFMEYLSRGLKEKTISGSWSNLIDMENEWL